MNHGELITSLTFSASSQVHDYVPGAPLNGAWCPAAPPSASGTSSSAAAAFSGSHHYLPADLQAKCRKEYIRACTTDRNVLTLKYQCSGKFIKTSGHIYQVENSGY